MLRAPTIAVACVLGLACRPAPTPAPPPVADAGAARPLGLLVRDGQGFGGGARLSAGTSGHEVGISGPKTGSGTGGAP